MQRDIDKAGLLFRSVLQPGRPATVGPLTLVPLFGGVRAPQYAVAADLAARGMLSIREVDGGVVERVVARNGTPLPALLIDGEHLEGAKQNRILNATVVAAPNADTVLPVSCVEQSRWHYEARPDFVPGRDVAYGRLRAQKAARVAASVRGGRGRAADQGEVWAEVRTRRAEVGVTASATGAMRDAYERHRLTLDELVRGFPRPEEGQTGVAACIGGRVVAVDAFDRPETLGTYWDRLVSGYALDAIGRAPAPAPDPGVRRVLHEAAQGAATAHKGVGLGVDVVLTAPSLVANALVWGGGVVHATVFPSVPARGGGGAVVRSAIERPGRRSRLRGQPPG